jgi:hypothetical protein
MEDDDIRRLLAEIRDAQRAQLEEFRRAASHAADLEKEARERQQTAVRLTRRIALAGGIVFLALLTLLVFLLARWWPYLLRG